MKSAVVCYALIGSILFTPTLAFTADKWQPMTIAERAALQKAADQILTNAHKEAAKRALPLLIKESDAFKKDIDLLNKSLRKIQGPPSLLDLTQAQIANRQRAIRQLTADKGLLMKFITRNRAIITNARRLLRIKIAGSSKILPVIGTIMMADEIAQAIFHSREVIQKRIDELTKQIDIIEAMIVEMKQKINDTQKELDDAFLAVANAANALAHDSSAENIKKHREAINYILTVRATLEKLNSSLDELETFNKELEAERLRLQLILKPMAHNIKLRCLPTGVCNERAETGTKRIS